MTPSLKNIRDDLSSLEEWHAQENVETNAEVYLDGEELVLRLNEAAAVHLCRQILDCVSKGFPGAHCHLDELNFVDEGNGRLRIESDR